MSETAIHVTAIVALLATLPYSVQAQGPPPVPSTFQDLYTELDNYLVNFNATLTANGSIQPYPVLWTGSLKAANGNIGPQLISGQSGMLLQLQAKTTYTDNSLTPGTTYYYAVQAADMAQDLSSMSAPAPGTTLP